MFTSAQLDAYLERIGLRTARRTGLRTLVALHRAHIEAIAYESLDIHLGRPIRLERDALFEKLVERRRGGFCYEQNEVMAHALEAMGFEVVRMRGGVARAVHGDREWFNHLPLLVRLKKGDYLADAGLGLGFCDPLPLAEGSHRVGSFNFSLRRLDERLWRCSLDPRVELLSFDFDLSPRRIEDYGPKCRELETSPESGFVKTLAVERPRPHEVRALRARTLTVHDPKLPDGKSVATVETAEEFGRLLTDEFGLALTGAEIAELWPRACEQHRRHLAEQEEKAAHSA
ncbi:arylamine N-acetyltransferase family protein [Glycomyces xiaoerkulensis]|uniref:arylamine N-acetyltransferase family protein n=1 Tax=Glycomyces xiaoerkulensis TaxID=2038139 RepID=UPI0012FFE80F|nr:arylamine N-acetyltransferase [Glycomyces xiaoerkulensis]